MDRSVEFLRTLNIEDDYIVVGCSGGPDSMCLLNMLMQENYKIICAHVNHNIRPESESEYLFLKDYCQSREIIFEGIELSKNKLENESFYRRKRYAFYKSLANKYDTNMIMTAHHGDDLIETILMRLTRGSHLKGYMGFPKIYKEGKYTFVKPLVYYTKDDILTYLKEHSIPFVHDKTNDEDSYTRNRYRHKVLPFLKSENREVHLKYLKYSEELASAYDYIQKKVTLAMAENYRSGTLKISKFLDLDKFIEKKELESIMRDLYGDDIDHLSDNHIQSILTQLEKKNNFTIHLPLGLNVKREYDLLKFSFESEKSEPYELEFENTVTLPNGDMLELAQETEDTSNYTTRLYSKDLSMPLLVRSRRQGDAMEVKNMSGTKKIKTILIDEKVPTSQRDTIPIVTDSDGTIVWLPGIKKSKFDINKKGKYDIILKYIKREENIDEKN